MPRTMGAVAACRAPAGSCVSDLTLAMASGVKGFNGHLWRSATGDAEPAAARARERLVLRDSESRAGGDLRLAQRDQLRARRVVHARRDARVDGAVVFRPAVLGDAGAGAVDRGAVRHRDRTLDAALAVQARSPVRAAADVRPHAGRRRRVPLDLRFVRPAVRRAVGAVRRDQSRLHVPAELSRVGGGRVAGRSASRRGS